MHEALTFPETREKPPNTYSVVLWFITALPLATPKIKFTRPRYFCLFRYLWMHFDFFFTVDVSCLLRRELWHSHFLDQMLLFLSRCCSYLIEMALRNMKNVKATRPANLPVEVWKSLGRTQWIFWRKHWTRSLMRRRSHADMWPKSILIPIFKNKGEIMNYGNYRGTKLMCHSMKLYESVHENRLRNIVSIL